MTFFAKWVGGSESPNFLAWNRNKRSIALNLKSRKVHAIIMEMAKKADVVVQNFRPGVLAKLGYGYEDFKAVNPRIIYCSGSGYGEEGPYVERPGQDMLIQGLAGLIANTGRGDQAPVPAGAGLADQIGAMNMVYGILSALYYREKTGKGQKIEVNLLAGLLAHLNQEYVAVLNLGEDFVRPNSGIGHPGMQAPFGIYETKDGGYVSIAMSPFKTLYEVLEAPQLAVYDDLKTLFDKRDEVFDKVNAETRKFATQDLLARLLAADIWCAEVKDIRHAAEDPQVTHMGMITSYEHPRGGTVRVVAPAVKMSETPGHHRAARAAGRPAWPRNPRRVRPVQGRDRRTGGVRRHDSGRGLTMAAYQTLTVENSGRVAVVTFRRADQLNAMNRLMQGEITEAFEALSADAGVGAIVVTGEGRGFMAGADIKEYAAQTAAEFDSFQAAGTRMYAAIENNRKPVIAAVNGFALGGGMELVLCCDIVIANQFAKLGLPEIKLGLIPGGGGTQRSVAKLGRNRANFLLMTGAIVPASEFVDAGLVNEVVDVDRLMPRALELAADDRRRARRRDRRPEAADGACACRAIWPTASPWSAIDWADLYRSEIGQQRVKEFADRSAARVKKAVP